MAKFRKEHPEKDQQKLRENYDRALADIVLSDAPDLVIAVGFMHILSAAFLNPLKTAGVEAINLHPALPGTFVGAKTIERAYKAFLQGEITKTGVTVHRLILDLDAGRPIVVREVEINVGDTLEDLESRLHSVEWVAIVEAVKRVIEDSASGIK